METTENTIGKMPLIWFPRLKKANEAALQQFELWADNTWIHWEDIGEDFIDFLQQRDQNKHLRQNFSRASEASFSKVWDNDDDALYDKL